MYFNLNKLVMQIKDLSVKDRITIGITILFWVSCGALGVALPYLIVHFLK